MDTGNDKARGRRNVRLALALGALALAFYGAFVLLKLAERGP